MFKKIGVLQFVVLLYLARTFSTLTYTLGTGNDWNSMSFFIGAIFSFILQALLIIPALILYKKSSNKDVIMSSYDVYGKGGHVVAILYFVVFLFISINTIVDTVFLLDNAIYTDSSSFTLIAVLILVCVYAASAGIESISRAGFIIFIFFIIFTIILFVSLSDEVNTFNIAPISEEPFRKISDSVFNNFARSSEIIALILLLPYVQGNYKKGIVWFFILTFITFEVVVFFILTVFGNFSDNLGFPFYSLISISGFNVFEHTDSVHIGIWIFISFIKISMYLYLAFTCFQKVLPTKMKKHGIWVIGIVLFAAIVPIRYSLKAIFSMTSIVKSGIIPIVFAFVIPMVVLISLSLKLKKGKSDEKKDYSIGDIADYN